jgi:amino acid transporter
VTGVALGATGVGLGFGLWLGPAVAFDVMTTAVLFGLVTAHTLMNVSLMRLSYRERRAAQVLFHLLLPVLAMLLFWFVLYESVVPVVFPLAWAALLWVAVLVPSVAWAWHAAGAPRLAAEAGRLLGLAPEQDSGPRPAHAGTQPSGLTAGAIRATTLGREDLPPYG